MCVLVEVIRFFLYFRHSKQLQSQRNAIYFLDLAAEQRIQSPLLFSFDCVRDGGDALGCRAVDQAVFIFAHPDCEVPQIYYSSRSKNERLFSAIWIRWLFCDSSASSRAATVSKVSVLGF